MEYIVAIALGLGFLYVGVKGFTHSGLPLTKKKRLTGKNI